MGSTCRSAVYVLVLVQLAVSVAPPFKTSFEFGSDEDPIKISKSMSAELLKSNSRFDGDFCNLVHRAVPDAFRDGKLITEPTMSGSSDAIARAPPSGFIPKMGYPQKPKFKPLRLGVPRLKVPQLKYVHGRVKAPNVGRPMLLLPWRREEETSAEKMERFKKGVQKMLNFVKIIGKIDKYVSERTRIVVDKLSKTLAE